MQPVREVYSLLMPVQDGRIIVPRAAVAEVMGYMKPKNRPNGAPDFLLGFIDWQGQKIPLVSFEAARGQGVPELGRRTRIAVVFGIGGRLKPDVFAVVTQGYPYLVRVNENVLQSEPMETEDPLVLARVRMANEKPFIPDLERLEQRIADGLGLPTGDDGSAAEPVDELDTFGVGDEDDFDAGALQGDDLDFDVPETDVDFGGAVAFDAGNLPERDESAGAPDGEGAASWQDTAAIDLGDVTAFGTETSYSEELGELSDALKGGDISGEDVTGDDVIDLSGLELEEGEGDDENPDDNAGEIDFSDIRIDFDIEDDDDNDSDTKDDDA